MCFKSSSLQKEILLEFSEPQPRAYFANIFSTISLSTIKSDRQWNIPSTYLFLHLRKCFSPVIKTGIFHIDKVYVMTLAEQLLMEY